MDLGFLCQLCCCRVLWALAPSCGCLPPLRCPTVFFWVLGTTGEDEGLGTLSCPCGVAGADWALLAAQISDLLADGGRMPLLLGSRG